jgi:hypothetical protein
LGCVAPLNASAGQPPPDPGRSANTSLSGAVSQQDRAVPRRAFARESADRHSPSPPPSSPERRRTAIVAPSGRHGRGCGRFAVESRRSSRLMPARLRRHGHNTSPNRRTLCHGVVKETKCGATNIAPKQTKQKTNVQTRTYRQTPVCFNLALNPNSTEATPTHAKIRLMPRHNWTEIDLSCAHHGPQTVLSKARLANQRIEKLAVG